MYICEECEKVFEEPKVLEEHHPYGMTYATEYFAVCPYCESTNYEEAHECERCGEYFVSLLDGLCDICFEDMYE